MAELKQILIGVFVIVAVLVMIVDHYSKTDEEPDDYGHLNYDDDNRHLKNFQLIRLQALEGQLATDERYKYVVNDLGNLKIELVSTAGDCDLYAMEGDVFKDANSFTHNTLKSISFDKDFVYIGDFVKRPVTVIVHAHPDQLKCSFRLTKYLISTRDPRGEGQYNGGMAHKNYQPSDVVRLNVRNSDYMFFYLPNLLEGFYFKQIEQNHSSSPDYFGEFDQQDDGHATKPAQTKAPPVDDAEDNEEAESIIWTVFVHLISFLAEALL